MGIIGGLLFETPSMFLDWHQAFGLLLIIGALAHIAAHSLDKNKDILTKDPLRDFKTFLHSTFYLIGFAKREDLSGGGRYYARQRIVYISLVYTIGLAAISGFPLYIGTIEGSFSSMLKVTHILAGISIILILLFHLAINIRRHDLHELKCSFATGKLPLWHLKKHHKIWYFKILGRELRRVKRYEKPVHYKSKDPIARAIIEFYALNGINPTKEAIKAMIKNFKSDNDPEVVERFVELSKMLK